MSSPAIFYSRWCFYCTSGHDSAVQLRAHVGTEHPDSPRDRLYREEGPVNKGAA